MTNGEFSLLKTIIIGHWISVWGFDDKKKVFYLYDSAAPLIELGKGLPVGNVVRSYKDVLRDWKFGGRLGFGSGKYKYIALENIQA